MLISEVNTSDTNMEQLATDWWFGDGIPEVVSLPAQIHAGTRTHATSGTVNVKGKVCQTQLFISNL